MKHLKILLSLLLAALLLLGVGVAEQPVTIGTLAPLLLQAQNDYDLAEQTLADLNDQAAELIDRSDRNPDDLDLLDRALEAMALQEEADAAYTAAWEMLTELQALQARLTETAECEALTVEHDGKFADLLVTVHVDENMVIHDLAVTVDGGERDQLVARNSYLYQFLGKDLPMTIGEGKTDDVAPLRDAQQTSKDLVAALNSLVYQEPDPTPAAQKAEKKVQGPIIEPQAIADYIFEHGALPENFITKSEAKKLGWDSSWNDVSDVAPGKSIGGDRFGNYEKLLPEKKGRVWYEADCYYTRGNRNARRILFSNDGLVYYTDDHYKTAVQLFPSNSSSGGN